MQLSMLSTALLALIPVVSAGYGGGSSSGGSSVSTPAQAANGVQVVNVGKNGQTMEPEDVVVPRGEIIEFHFFTGAHSVAQSAFDSPCTPLNATAGNGTEGFFSGPQQVSSGEGPNVFRVVSTGNPMWFYCATQRHCQNGMVGVINKPASGARTLAQYKAGAARAASNVSPSAVRGGDLVQANTPTGGSGTPTGGSGTGGSGTGPTSGPGSAGVGSLSALSLPFLGLAAAAAVGLAL